MHVSNNCEKDAILVGIINSATSLYASIVVFAILGFKANNDLQNCQTEYVATFNEMTRQLDLNIDEGQGNYSQLVEYVKTNPAVNSTLSLRECDLSTFLDQVIWIDQCSPKSLRELCYQCGICFECFL